MAKVQPYQRGISVAFGLGGLLGTVAVDLARYFLGSPVAAFALVFAGQAALFLIAAGLAARVGKPHQDRYSKGEDAGFFNRPRL